ncbi:MAG: hypothetical protein NC321_12895 [Clostridium sp.]|nr:hypothetical protein [Clostridium sp.]
MAINEQIVTGRKWRTLVDEATKLWQRISFWTKASDVEFDDGQTAENKMGAISGITSDLNGESENIAASIKAVNQLNNQLNGCDFNPKEDGLYVTYTLPGGADSVTKKLGEYEVISGQYTLSYTSQIRTVPVPRRPRLILIDCISGQGVNLKGGFWSGIEKANSSQTVSWYVKSVSDSQVVFGTLWDTTITWQYYILY